MPPGEVGEREKKKKKKKKEEEREKGNVCHPEPQPEKEGLTCSRMCGRISFELKNVLIVGSAAFIAVACFAIRSAWNPTQLTWHSSLPM